MLKFLAGLARGGYDIGAGQRKNHSNGAHSIDLFLPIQKLSDGFYDPGETTLLIQKAVVHGLENGYVFRILYNDPRVANAVNSWAGASIVGRAPDHGPAPFKLHLHVDVYPFFPGAVDLD